MAKATSDSVVDTRRKLGLVLVGLLVLCISVKVEANFTLWVSRRSTGDVYQLTSMAHMSCDPKASYSVHEKQCVLDEELYSGMTFTMMY